MKKVLITIIVTATVILSMSCSGQDTQTAYEEGYNEGVKAGYDMAKEQAVTVLESQGAVQDIVFDGVENDGITNYYELGDYVRSGILVMLEDEMNNPND